MSSRAVPSERSTSGSHSSIVRALAVANDSDPGRILQIAVDGIVEVLGVDVAYVKLDEGVDPLPKFQVVECKGDLGPRFRQLVVAPGQGLAGLVARAGRPLAVRDYRSTKWITHEFAGIIEEEGLRAIACAPIPGSDRTLGLLSAGFRSSRSFGDQEISILEDIANCAGVAMQQALASARRAEFERLNERHRLATELHDSVAQSLFAIGVEVNRSRDRRGEEAVQEAFDRIQTLAASASSELRSRLKAMSAEPAVFALESVVEAEARQCEEATGATVKVIKRGGSRKLPELHEELICNTVREGLRNAVKHAHAELILVHLCFADSEVRVAIQADRGAAAPGADGSIHGPVRIADKGNGSGLQLLSAAAGRLGGTLDLELGDCGESTLTMRLPLNRY